MKNPVRVLYLFKQVETVARARLDAGLREHQLTSSQYTVLSLLDRPVPLSSAQVARRSFVTPQATKEMIASLKKKGLIERHEDENNRRILRLSLTPLGRRVLAKCARDADRIEAEILRGLSARESKALMNALMTIVSTVREDTMGS